MLTIRRFSFLCMTLFLSNLAAYGQTTPTGNGQATTSDTVEGQQVLAAEDAYVIAELTRNESALQRIVDDRFIMNGNDGTTSNKAALIRNVLSMNMLSQKLTDRTVVLEDDVALIFGTTELRLAPPGGDERISVLRYTSTYIRRQGEWRMLALHMVPHTGR